MDNETTVTVLNALGWVWPVYSAIMLGFSTWLFRTTQMPGTAVMAFGFGITLLVRAVIGIAGMIVSNYFISADMTDVGFPDWYWNLTVLVQILSAIGHAAVLVGFATLCTHLVQRSRSGNAVPNASSC